MSNKKKSLARYSSASCRIYERMNGTHTFSKSDVNLSLYVNSILLLLHHTRQIIPPKA